MATMVHVPLEEYLNTNYEPDCDYVDGAIEERNVGRRKHSETHVVVSAWLSAREPQHRHRVLIAQRVQVLPSRVRIPDICLVAASDKDEVTQNPPTLCVEILSPDDRFSRVEERLADFLNFGVGTVWIIDPYSREAWIATPKSPAARLVDDGTLRCEDLNLEVALSDILPEE